MPDDSYDAPLYKWEHHPVVSKWTPQEVWRLTRDDEITRCVVRYATPLSGWELTIYEGTEPVYQDSYQTLVQADLAAILWCQRWEARGWHATQDG